MYEFTFAMHDFFLYACCPAAELINPTHVSALISNWCMDLLLNCIMINGLIGKIASPMHKSTRAKPLSHNRMQTALSALNTRRSSERSETVSSTVPRCFRILCVIVKKKITALNP